MTTHKWRPDDGKDVCISFLAVPVVMVVLWLALPYFVPYNEGPYIELMRVIGDFFVSGVLGTTFRVLSWQVHLCGCVMERAIPWMIDNKSRDYLTALLSSHNVTCSVPPSQETEYH